LFGLNARTLLTGPFGARSFLESSRPIAEITVYVIDRPVVTRFGSSDGVDGRWRRGIMRVLVRLNSRTQVPNTLLELFKDARQDSTGHLTRGGMPTTDE